MPIAERDLAEIDASIARDSTLAADRFLDLLAHRIEPLELFPRRGAPAREGDGYGLQVRQLVVRRYRILYHVRGDTVFVLRVGHGHRRSLNPGRRG